VAGDAEAVGRFVERMACIPRLLAVINRRIRSPLRAEELVDVGQETFAALWRKVATYRGQARLETWAYRFCELELFAAVNRRRRQARGEGGPEGLAELDADPQPTGLVMYDYLFLRLKRLPDLDQELIRLKFFEDLTFVEIGRRVSLPVNTVKSRYYRAMVRLRDLLRPILDQEEA
jgi:RNA polymerase sigma-70 factor (ECF subfamily)